MIALKLFDSFNLNNLSVKYIILLVKMDGSLTFILIHRLETESILTIEGMLVSCR